MTVTVNNLSFVFFVFPRDEKVADRMMKIHKNEMKRNNYIIDSVACVFTRFTRVKMHLAN